MSLRITELVNCKYTGRSHLECNHHKLIEYRVGTLSMCSQCIHNVPGGCTDPCPQCQEVVCSNTPLLGLEPNPQVCGQVPSQVRLVRSASNSPWSIGLYSVDGC